MTSVSRLLMALCALAAACRKAPPSTRPPAPSVEVSGCAAVRDGAVCELPALRRVRLVVRGVKDAPVTVRAAGAIIAPRSRTIVADAARLEVDVPEGARTVEVTVGESAAAALRFEADSVPEWARQARGARARGALDLALSQVAAHADGPAAERGFARGISGRVALSRGDFARAVSELEAARAAHIETGRVSDAVDDGLAETFVLAERMHDYVRARAVLATLGPLAARSPDGWAALPYYEALVARATGDLGSNLSHAREAEARAELLGQESDRREAVAERARTWGQSGRFREACALFRDLAATRAEGEGACAGPRRRVSLAVTALDAEETTGAIPAECPKDPAPVVASALADFERACPDASQVTNARIVLARAHIATGDAARADEVLGGLVASDLEPTHRVATGILRGRAAALRRHFDVALGHYERAAIDAEALGLPLHALRAAVGAAAALNGKGERERALALLARATERLGMSALAIPVAEGRATFAGTVDLATRARFDLLLALGRDRDAIEEALRARARAAIGAEVGPRLAALPEEARRRWDDAVGAYHRARAQLEAAQQAASELSRDARDARMRALHQAEAGLRLELGTAVDAASTGLPASRGVAWPCPRSSGRSTWLVLARLERGVVALFGEENGRVRRVAMPSIPEGDDARGAAILGPAADVLERTDVLRVVADSALDDVDVHALAFHGAPLGARLAVEYSVRGACPDPRSARLARGERALLVGDATGDLPGARDEVRAVGDALHRAGVAARRLVQTEASGPSVRAAWGEAAALHYAGHARPGGEPWTSALLLHDGHRLDVADVLSLGGVPRVVVLSACDGARETREAMGLGQALVRMGALAVVAPVRPVRDRALSLYWTRYYEALTADGASASRAARAATEAIAREAPADLADALAYRVLTP